MTKEVNKNKWEKLFDDFMDLTEFKLVKYRDCEDEYNPALFGLIDLQNGNIGGIQDDRFSRAEEIFERMDIYIYDYIVSAIEDCLEEKDIEYNYNDYSDLLKYRDLLPDNEFEFDLIEMLCFYYGQIDLFNCNFDEGEEYLCSLE